MGEVVRARCPGVCRVLSALVLKGAEEVLVRRGSEGEVTCFGVLSSGTGWVLVGV